MSFLSIETVAGVIKHKTMKDDDALSGERFTSSKGDIFVEKIKHQQKPLN